MYNNRLFNKNINIYIIYIALKAVTGGLRVSISAMIVTFFPNAAAAVTNLLFFVAFAWKLLTRFRALDEKTKTLNLQEHSFGIVSKLWLFRTFVAI